MRGSDAADRSQRGVSEMTSVMTLLAIAGVIIIAVGGNVLFLEADREDRNAAFSFSYFEDGSQLLITHDGGQEFKAGNLLIQGPEAEATWSELDTNMNQSSLVSEGDAVSILRQNAYGENVAEDDQIEVMYVNATAEERSVLATWNGTEGL